MLGPKVFSKYHLLVEIVSMLELKIRVLLKIWTCAYSLRVSTRDSGFMCSAAGNKCGVMLTQRDPYL
jgi:hypothetical protein